MIERGIYYANNALKKLIKEMGGEWNDSKKRPIVCLIKSTEKEGLYWAIPMGKYNHREAKQITRLNRYLNYDNSDIRSCYYHVGRTTAKSIFFISDAIPITDKYILEEHVNHVGDHFIIKNPNLIRELERKLFRILALENSDPNHFRQHITDVKNALILELDEAQNNKQ